MILEVIATSVKDAKLAEQGGAGRIELISGMSEGGVTPSLGLVEAVTSAVKIPVMVMIRPHAGSFVYDVDDVSIMIADMRKMSKLPIAGFVLGALRKDGSIDTETMAKLLEAAAPLDITFHRAFDEIPRREEALEQLAAFPQIKRILTSGGRPKAPEALPEIERLTKLGRASGISIMPGSGVTLDNLSEILRATGAREIHMGTALREGGDVLKPVDPNKVRRAADIVKSIERGREQP